MMPKTNGEPRTYRRSPLSAPGGALLAVGLLFIVWGSVAPIAGIAIGTALRISYSLVGEHFLIVLGISAAPFLAVALGCRGGSTWAIFLFRILSGIALASFILDTGIGLLLAYGLVGFAEKTSRDTGLYVCFCAIILLAVSLLLVWSIRRVRWLDPYSTPDEWETPVNPSARKPI